MKIGRSDPKRAAAMRHRHAIGRLRQLVEQGAGAARGSKQILYGRGTTAIVFSTAERGPATVRRSTSCPDSSSTHIDDVR
ncbi:MAG: hypothetical protein U0575_09570 [Phycisphaerales bacterium]